MQVVDSNIAILLKNKLKYDQLTDGCWEYRTRLDGTHYYRYKHICELYSIEGPVDWNNDFKTNLYFSAPTQSQLQKWIREEFKLSVEAYYDLEFCEFKCSWTPMGVSISEMILNGKNSTELDLYFDQFKSKKLFETYEEALEEGLYQALMKKIYEDEK